ncbi:bifunctional methylenetetrahydrofolate dehydrogenase/methenyltetrahydrofolate cyclohydrolase FolD [Oleispirillum naphthae]|uniref:bifunctional methylenetetrahydrofolate dehydrogenase/methenyltetrahydrofolate cyclohydrolase FolD n=1 Tax=Oleispirillum naphthae TaxID=2838853 RepID=UPI0030822760
MTKTSPARIIDGKAVSAAIRAELARHVAIIREQRAVQPGLAVILIGDDAPSQVYVKSKEKLAAEAGFRSVVYRRPADTPEEPLLTLIEGLNEDPEIHGILVQLPVPPQIDEAKVIETISPEKDVDGFHPMNVGRLATGQDAPIPCTPLGCLTLLKRELGDLAGLHAVVVGRSNIVGKPMATLLLRENCTVTMAHSRTRDLPALCREADILVPAIGKPRFIRGDWVKPGAAVIDVGINRIDAGKGDGSTRLVGDVDFDEAVKVAGLITPVPGGVGPMTIAMLLRNTLEAYCRIHRIAFPLA